MDLEVPVNLTASERELIKKILSEYGLKYLPKEDDLDMIISISRQLEEILRKLQV